ncbi:hypothetical protein BDD12DRAFT_858949 [Trichophaea hybrida]|nr:hypothetical protein BDD12DRAFT_858949 [Trichophaea hybrida]
MSTSYRALRARYLVQQAISRDKFSRAIPVPGATEPPSDNSKADLIPSNLHNKHESVAAAPVCIVGAGVSGLYAAMILDSLKIDYEILEASDRYGGRCFTYKFSETENYHDYFDVGAMRFPDISTMDRTFDLFKRLGIKEGNKLIPYIMSAKNNIMLYNDIKKVSGDAGEPSTKEIDDDPFHDCVKNAGDVPDQYATLTYKMPDGTERTGVAACLAAAFEPFKDRLVEDWDGGWAYLMQYDALSTRAFLLKEMGYPLSVVRWMETRDTSTGAYDLAFSESVLDSLDFDYPNGINTTRKSEDEETKWYCIDGGTEELTKTMYERISKDPTHIPKYNHRVDSISMVTPNAPTSLMKITVRDHPEFDSKEYSHVISTIPFSCLRCVDLTGSNLDYKQKQALRCLNYGAGIKVGIKFKTRWWQDEKLFPPQMGGVSSTDRQSRVVVYPSYGLKDDPTDPGVLIAAYNWTQDAYRFGSLITFKDWSKKMHTQEVRESEKFLLDQVYNDLAALHGKTPDWYKDQTLDYYAYDWYRNEYTMGAFALFGPGQFDDLYPEITKPAARGNLHFAGEAASTHHAWISGALDSAWRCVHEILLKERSPKLAEFLRLWGHSKVLESEQEAEWQVLRGICSKELETETAAATTLVTVAA